MKSINKLPGSITLLLCMIFTLLLSVVLLTMESARIQCIKTKSEGISHLSLESVMGYFSLPLYERYGLFGIHTSDDAVSLQLNNYISRNFNPVSCLEGSVYDLFQIESFDSTPCKIYHLTDNNGSYFIKQIIDYMQYGTFSSSVNFISDYDLYGHCSGNIEASDLSNDTYYELDITEEDAVNTKDSILSKMQELTTNASLTLYISSTDKVSGKSVDTASLPSKTCIYDQDTVFHSETEKLLFLLYLSDYFSCYTSDQESENNSLDYQLEYVLNGSSHDDDNLLQSLKKIQNMRTALNLSYLYTDTWKRTEARSLAFAAVGTIPVPFIVEVTQLSILSAWASAEAIIDVRSLLKGEKIPLFKTKSSWTLELSDLLVFDQNTTAKKSTLGFTYDQYLSLLIYSELNTDLLFRTMDIIQLNISTDDSSDFRLSSCITGLKYNFTYDFHPLFCMPDFFYKKTSLFQHTFTQSYGY